MIERVEPVFDRVGSLVARHGEWRCESPGDPWRQLRECACYGIGNLCHAGHGLGATACKGLDSHSGQRVEIGAPVHVGCAAELFGGHVRRRAEGSSALGQCRSLGGDVGYAEVGEQPAFGILFEEDVGRFDVPVHDAAVMGERQRASDLRDELLQLIV